MNGTDLYPHDAGFPRALTDVSDAAQDVSDLRLVADAKGWDRLPTLPRLARLWCFGVNEKRLAAITQCRSLTRLYLDGVRAPLKTLEQLSALVVLSLESATRMASLAEAGGTVPLEGLSVTNAPKVSSLAPLMERHQLRALNVSGSIWSKMTVDSLEPLTGLKSLEYLDLMNLTVRDGSLQPLGSLANLKDLDLPNFYSVSEFASLASRLRQTRCRWFRPTVDLPNVPCQKCGKKSLVLLTGKGNRAMCRSCDSTRIERHEDLFHKLAA